MAISTLGVIGTPCVHAGGALGWFANGVCESAWGHRCFPCVYVIYISFVGMYMYAHNTAKNIGKYGNGRGQKV